MESCKCAPQKAVENIRNIEMIYLVFILIGIFTKVVCLLSNCSIPKFITKGTSQYTLPLLFFTFSYMFGMISIFALYVYNIYEFHNSLKSNCKCSNGWQNNILYVHALYMSVPILLLVLSVLYDFKVNTSLLVLVFIYIIGIYLYENYVIKKGITVESYVSILKDYQESNNVFVPNNYHETSELKPSIVDDTKYSPNIAQPNQKYRQIKPEEYPTKDNSYGIQTPLSSHESIVNKLRKKLEY